ncbi:hypothetical protein HK101_005656, partial [Irineochytrium annulatum]
MSEDLQRKDKLLKTLTEENKFLEVTLLETTVENERLAASNLPLAGMPSRTAQASEAGTDEALNAALTLLTTPLATDIASSHTLLEEPRELIYKTSEKLQWERRQNKVFKETNEFLEIVEFETAVENEHLGDELEQLRSQLLKMKTVVQDLRRENEDIRDAMAVGRNAGVEKSTKSDGDAASVTRCQKCGQDSAYSSLSEIQHDSKSDRTSESSTVWDALKNENWELKETVERQHGAIEQQGNQVRELEMCMAELHQLNSRLSTEVNEAARQMAARRKRFDVRKHYDAEVDRWISEIKNDVEGLRESVSKVGEAVDHHVTLKQSHLAEIASLEHHLDRYRRLAESYIARRETAVSVKCQAGQQPPVIDVGLQTIDADIKPRRVDGWQQTLDPPEEWSDDERPPSPVSGGLWGVIERDAAASALMGTDGVYSLLGIIGPLMAV